MEKEKPFKLIQCKAKSSYSNYTKLIYNKILLTLAKQLIIYVLEGMSFYSQIKFTYF